MAPNLTDLLCQPQIRSLRQACDKASERGAKAATDNTPVTDERDDSYNAHLPEWKRRHIRANGDCKAGGWKGSCFACFELCKGQHRWTTAPNARLGPNQSQ